MKITLIRDWFFLKMTMGYYLLNDQPLLLEGRQVYSGSDVARPDGVKIKNETCISAGTGFIGINFSNRFQRMMPILYNQPDFSWQVAGVTWTGVRQHIGNYDGDTEACELLGFTRSDKGVFTSTACFTLYFPFLEELIKQNSGAIPFEIINRQA